MYWFLLLLIPIVIRPDIVFNVPYFTWTKAAWETPVKRGANYTQAGLEAQQQWIGDILFLFTPYLILAILAYLT